jgi:hypothetical protein
MLKVEIKKKKTKSMRLVYNPTKKNKKKIIKYNSQNNIILKD